ncbi:hypothetical protein XELAEV_18003887mg [Xenopus laevis]|nr:hypothetical protein XELAEV_18003887mg [Xenopus laevis]
MERGKLHDVLRWVREEAGDEDIQSLLMLLPAAHSACPVSPPYEEAASPPVPRRNASCAVPAGSARRVSMATGPVKKKVSMRKSNLQPSAPSKLSPGHDVAAGIWPSCSPPVHGTPAAAASSSSLGPLAQQSCSTILPSAGSASSLGAFRSVAADGPATAGVSLSQQLQDQDAAGCSATAVSEQLRVLGNYDNADVLNVLLSSLSSGAVSKQSSTGISENAFKDSILCDTTPLGLHLPQAVRDKIVRGEYVDLLSLLPSAKEFLVKNDKVSEVEIDRRRPVARTFSNWLQAFCIYANVLCAKQPHLSSGLFKHVDIILEAYKAYGGIAWFIYDDRFRQKMSIQRSIPWGSKDIDLWMGMLIPRFQPREPASGTKVPVKQNACWAFNESACRWQGNCRFKHECAHCGGGHPAFRCVKRFVSSQTKPPSRDSGFRTDNPSEVGRNVALSKSIRSNPQIVVEKIDKELALGRIQGPFVDPPFDYFRVSPLGVVPKKDPGSFRLIHHLSFPSGDSVNDGIGRELSSVSYASFDNAVAVVQRCVSQALGVQQSAGSSRDALPELFVGPCAARVQRWLTCSLADKTWQSYLDSWCKWIAFKDGLHQETGLSDKELILWFVLEQGQAGYSASSIQKHFAGISFWLKLLGLEDVTKSFLVKQILKGISRMGRSSDTRKPITLLILSKLLAALPQVCFSPYEQVLFRVLFIFCFFAALRVSEAVSSSKSIPGGLQWGDVALVNEKLRLLIRSSKTDQSGKAFAAIRPSVCGPFFIHADGSSLTKYQFSRVLHDCIVRVGLSPDDYKTHSFRIGAATQASILGFSDMSIQKLGRWSSKRFFVICPPCFS